MCLLITLNYSRVNLQCSEICGVYHAFMPIAVEAVSVQDYLAWVDAA
jgi:heme/copper-type cytochrome/quinol oxidase subunit 2